jgi:hypothetical protein
VDCAFVVACYTTGAPVFQVSSISRGDGWGLEKEQALLYRFHGYNTVISQPMNGWVVNREVIDPAKSQGCIDNSTINNNQLTKTVAHATICGFVLS